MAWSDYTDVLAKRGFIGACIIDRSTYAVLAQFGDSIPRGYQIDEDDINENTYLAEAWNHVDFTHVRFNQVKYDVERKDEDGNYCFGKKVGTQVRSTCGIHMFKLNTIFLIGVCDNKGKLSLEEAQDFIQTMVRNFRAANVGV